MFQPSYKAAKLGSTEQCRTILMSYLNFCMAIATCRPVLPKGLVSAWSLLNPALFFFLLGVQLLDLDARADVLPNCRQLLLKALELSVGFHISITAHMLQQQARTYGSHAL